MSESLSLSFLARPLKMMAVVEHTQDGHVGQITGTEVAIRSKRARREGCTP